MIKLLYILFLQFFITNYAFAYVDPGAGTFILQAILAFFGVIIFYLGYPIRMIKYFFKKKFEKDKNKSEEKK